MRCLARAYGGLALDRIVVEVRTNRAYIVKPSRVDAVGYDDNAGVGFPLNDVFQPDQILLDEIASVAESGNKAALDKLWERAKPLPL